MSFPRRRFFLLVFACLIPVFTRPAAAAETNPPDFGSAIEIVRRAAAAEIAQGNLSGVSIALVADQELLFADGFGWADKKRRVRAGPDTVYRAGSISKLFTAVAAMQLAEKKQLNIDQPAGELIEQFRIVNPFSGPADITLRQLMCHRSGLIRESPVGGYFDDAEASMTASVRSIADCVLVYPPGTRTKYSNIGVTVVGLAVESVAGTPFPAYQNEHCFTPLGMTRSSFVLNRRIKETLSTGYMLVADQRGGFREIPAPLFELGTLAAGNLYTTAPDLARFVSCLFAEGRAGEHALLSPETIREMFTPQLTKDTNGFGLGFHVGSFAGRKRISHTGAVYGFSSALSALPEEKVGVIVLANDDLATGPVMKLHDLALRELLRAQGRQVPPDPATNDLPAALLAQCTGEFESESYWAHLQIIDGQIKANVSGQLFDLRPTTTNRLVGQGRFAYDAPFILQIDTGGKEPRVTGFNALGQTFKRVGSTEESMSGTWQRYLGSYGPSFIPLIISLRNGHLYAMTENMFDYRLTPLNQTVFKMPPGLYIDEQLVFGLDSRGRVHTAVLANMPLARRR